MVKWFLEYCQVFFGGIASGPGALSGSARLMALITSSSLMSGNWRSWVGSRSLLRTYVGEASLREGLGAPGRKPCGVCRLLLPRYSFPDGGVRKAPGRLSDRLDDGPLVLRMRDSPVCWSSRCRGFPLIQSRN
ncbi:hypothetical protein BJX76DRAFT_3795 [Aspergillus varians]